MRAQPAARETSIAERWRWVTERVAAAAARVGRRAEEVRIIAVTKTVAAPRVVEAVAAGAREFGENRVQEARAKVAEARTLLRQGAGDGEEAWQAPPPGAVTPRWHLIGHLQKNKVKHIFDLFCMVHSVDSLELAEEIERRGVGAGRVMPILLEVNIAAQAQKFGLPDDEVAGVAERVGKLAHVRLQGLMAIPPLSEDAETSRPYYAQVRRLAREIAALRLPGVGMDELSMGMTNDFEVAVEEGATMVRIGTAIFGPRPLS
ncbi:MAG: YggS family pyridoxal phosphate-dependent enzyme [Candidatus Tectomicrobia bacterium]|nr:YggS family pyridoxal phosphate-dependent enzyme [Candidatus Tectomicrobia bacterium]